MSTGEAFCVQIPTVWVEFFDYGALKVTNQALTDGDLIKLHRGDSLVHDANIGLDNECLQNLCKHFNHKSVDVFQVQLNLLGGNTNSMESVLSELRELGEQLATYIQHVKLLKNEEDVSSLKKAIFSLENDLKLLRTAYECQINHLSTTLNIVLDEKRDLENEILVRKENDAHFLDRISVESSKNAKLLMEISHLKTDVAEKNNQIMALKIHVQELETHGEEKETVKLKLTEEINLLKQKLSISEDLYTETANQLQSALLKINSQKLFTKERLSRSQNRIQWYISQFAAKDFQVEESRRREASISTAISQLRAKAQEELIQYRQQASEIYKKPIATLQSQLASERKENQLLKTKCLKNDQTILNLQRQVAELNSKINSTERHTELLKNALESLGKEHNRLRSNYEDKIQRLEASIASSAADFDSMKSKENEVMREILKFKSMLNLEEESPHSRIYNKQTNPINRELVDEGDLQRSENDKNQIKQIKELLSFRIEFDRTYRPKSISHSDCTVPSKSIHPFVMESNDELRDTSENIDVELQNCDQVNYDMKKFGVNSSKNAIIDTQIDGSIPGSPGSSMSLSGSNFGGLFHKQSLIKNMSSLNSIVKEIDIGLYKVWQKHIQEKINEYTFPADVRMSPRTVFTLWSNNAIIPKNVHNTKNVFRCPNVCKWFNGPNYITMVSNSHDEVFIVVSYVNTLYFF
ncbi:Abnormal long morphology protein 1 (Sp8),putative [Schistosoma mansoni]|uniref:Abnormal long morphology protein 1 (Sp8),putative n=1 Tax=Schistosoma mansoni TaxID=6183 RepID=UPI00022C855D|nr:Abnormal long morphology protein 1 (Sp8),putative [Schistosoma mansoni]|eukprot:XP_018645421.1 Abnormal long morphology protein 1 (Sp8),putative [Schistosoma mansoni]